MKGVPSLLHVPFFLDAILLEEVDELTDGHVARARLDLVVVVSDDDAGVAPEEEIKSGIDFPKLVV